MLMTEAAIIDSTQSTPTPLIDECVKTKPDQVNEPEFNKISDPNSSIVGFFGSDSATIKEASSEKTVKHIKWSESVIDNAGKNCLYRQSDKTKRQDKNQTITELVNPNPEKSKSPFASNRANDDKAMAGRDFLSSPPNIRILRRGENISEVLKNKVENQAAESNKVVTSHEVIELSQEKRSGGSKGEFLVVNMLELNSPLTPPPPLPKKNTESTAKAARGNKAKKTLQEPIALAKKKDKKSAAVHGNNSKASLNNSKTKAASATNTSDDEPLSEHKRSKIKILKRGQAIPETFRNTKEAQASVTKKVKTNNEPIESTQAKEPIQFASFYTAKSSEIKDATTQQLTITDGKYDEKTPQHDINDATTLDAYDSLIEKQHTERRSKKQKKRQKRNERENELRKLQSQKELSVVTVSPLKTRQKEREDLRNVARRKELQTALETKKLVIKAGKGIVIPVTDSGKTASAVLASVCQLMACISLKKSDDYTSSINTIFVSYGECVSLYLALKNASGDIENAEPSGIRELFMVCRSIFDALTEIRRSLGESAVATRSISILTTLKLLSYSFTCTAIMAELLKHMSQINKKKMRSICEIKGGAASFVSETLNHTNTLVVQLVGVLGQYVEKGAIDEIKKIIFHEHPDISTEIWTNWFFPQILELKEQEVERLNKSPDKYWNHCLRLCFVEQRWEAVCNSISKLESTLVPSRAGELSIEPTLLSTQSIVLDNLILRLSRITSAIEEGNFWEQVDLSDLDMLYIWYNAKGEKFLFGAMERLACGNRKSNVSSQLVKTTSIFNRVSILIKTKFQEMEKQEKEFYEKQLKLSELIGKELQNYKKHDVIVNKSSPRATNEAPVIITEIGSSESDSENTDKEPSLVSPHPVTTFPTAQSSIQKTLIKFQKLSFAQRRISASNIKEELEKQLSENKSTTTTHESYEALVTIVDCTLLMIGLEFNYLNIYFSDVNRYRGKLKIGLVEAREFEELFKNAVANLPERYTKINELLYEFDRLFEQISLNTQCEGTEEQMCVEYLKKDFEEVVMKVNELPEIGKLVFNTYKERGREIRYHLAKRNTFSIQYEDASQSCSASTNEFTLKVHEVAEASYDFECFITQFKMTTQEMKKKFFLQLR